MWYVKSIPAGWACYIRGDRGLDPRSMPLRVERDLPGACWYVGHLAEPLFAPGFHLQPVVGLIFGFIAKEVVVGSWVPSGGETLKTLAADPATVR